MTRALANKVKMNNVKLNFYKKILQEVYQSIVGVEGFIRYKLEEICYNEKLSVEEVRLRKILMLNFAMNVCFFKKTRSVAKSVVHLRLF